jgi:hypothetical protein
MLRRSMQGLGLATGVKVESLARDVSPCRLYTTAPCQVDRSKNL